MSASSATPVTARALDAELPAVFKDHAPVFGCCQMAFSAQVMLPDAAAEE
jgi:hypothetical protein